MLGVELIDGGSKGGEGESIESGQQLEVKLNFLVCHNSRAITYGKAEI